MGGCICKLGKEVDVKRPPEKKVINEETLRQDKIDREKEQRKIYKKELRKVMEEKLSDKIIRLVKQKSTMSKTVHSNDFSFEKTRKNQILP